MSGLNDITSGLSGIGTALGANFAQDPNQRQYYQGQQQVQQQEEAAQRQAVFEQNMESFERFRTMLSDPAISQDYLTNLQGPTRRLIDQHFKIFEAQSRRFGGDPSQVEVMRQELDLIANNPSQQDVTAQSPAGKISADLAAGLLSPEEARQGIQKEIGTEPTTDKAAGKVFQKILDSEALTDGDLRVLQLWQEGKKSVEVNIGEQKAETAGQTGFKAKIVLDDISRARSAIQNAPWWNPTTGFAGTLLKDVPGTEASNVKALLNTIRANIGFDRLQAMRDASKSGGALGQITIGELERLEATMGSLEQAQTQDQLIENMNRLEVIYNGILSKAMAYPNAAEYGFAPAGEAGGGKGVSDMSDEELLNAIGQ